MDQKHDFSVVNEPTINRNYYTDNRVITARLNVETAKWARRILNSSILEANKFVGREAELWDMVVPEGLPRGITVGYVNDPEAYRCRYCGDDLRQLNGHYPWLSAPFEDPWKIQCPACERRFPSNDFGSFYELGLDDRGNFCHDTAHRRNAELVASGEPGFLVNLLHPEKGEGWGVDDGFGYRTGRIYPNGVEEVHTYIAYFLHWGLWYQNRQNPGMLISALNSLRMAYLLTGDVSYGKTGAVLLYRIAELYPEYDLLPYHNFYNSHGFSFNGKILGRIWETNLSSSLILALDAFRPAFAYSEVQRFIIDRRPHKNYKQGPAFVESALDLLERNILHESVNGVKNGKIAGNFGMHQSVVALAAVVLSMDPESSEWIDWVFQPGRVGNDFVSGGNVLHQLVNHVTRDGHGYEVAPGYNRIWLNRMVIIADALSGYAQYPFVNLYNNPIFRSMFTSLAPLTLAGRNTAQIGNSGVTAGGGIIYRPIQDFIRGFEETGDPEIARWIHFVLGDEIKEIYGDIFSPIGADLAHQIQSVVSEKGPLDVNRSSMLPGFGFAAIRDYAPQGDDRLAVDTERSFWMFFGRTLQHGHRDALNIGMTAFGLDFAPDLGYPETAGREPNRHEWVNSTLSHNTVMVDDAIQQGISHNGSPRNFIGDGAVKLIDVDASAAYPNTEIYRRTLISVKVDEAHCYGVDFFRIRGGETHLYSFHSQSDKADIITGAEMVMQKTGTYAGPRVSYGPGGVTWPQGFSWLTNVRRSNGSVGDVSVGFLVKDFRNQVPEIDEAGLRLHFRNGFELEELAIARGYPPRLAANAPIPYLEYLLARRSSAYSGIQLDSLFTVIFEPYRDEPLLATIEELTVDLVEEYFGIQGYPVARALRITHRSGRVDTVVYSSHSNVKWRVDDYFNFRGTVGVIIKDPDGTERYSFVCDGDLVGKHEFDYPDLKGSILDFTQELTLDNTVTIKPERVVDDAEKLVGLFIYVENDGKQNAVYPIHGVDAAPDGAIDLKVGSNTLIRSYASTNSLDDGFIFNIARGQAFRIPFAHVNGYAP